MPKYYRRPDMITGVQLTRDAFNEAKAKNREDQNDYTEEEKILRDVQHVPGIGFVVATNKGATAVHVNGYIVRKPDGTYAVFDQEFFEERYVNSESVEESITNENPKPEETPRVNSLLDEANNLLNKG